MAGDVEALMREVVALAHAAERDLGREQVAIALHGCAWAYAADRIGEAYARDLVADSLSAKPLGAAAVPS